MRIPALPILVSLARAGCNSPGEGGTGNNSSALGGPLRLTATDVGQGDALVLIAPSGCAALIDGGPTGSGAAIKTYLRGLGVTNLDFAVTSHYHADHIGGIDEVDQGADAVPIAAVYDRGGTCTSATYTEDASRFAGRRLTVTVGQTLTLCNEVQLRVVAVNGNGTGTTDENARSVALKVSWGAFDALLGGDLTGDSPDIESRIAPTVGQVEVYKVHHHGSKTASNQTLVNALLPTVSLISVGKSNAYGHPASEVIARLQSAGSAIWQTEDPATATVRGNIEVTSPNGNTYPVAQGTTSTSFVSKGIDVVPPTVPTALTATAVATSRIDLAWAPSSDNVGVIEYRVYRDGALRSSTPVPSYADTGLAADESHSYAVTAVDGAGNASALSASASAQSFCATTITYKLWSTTTRKLTVRATCTRQPTAKLTAYGDSGALIGAMPWRSASSWYSIVVALPARPACVTVKSDCGGTATSCF
ncbi:MAG: MBL fold metallo-hydrolase [Myxococcales bacterium]|nr:MBL fold metallo-hydrolase [Myxococcales bacterium]